MKLMEIIIFLIIFSFVMNGLAVLRISSSSFATSDYDVSNPGLRESAMITTISIVLVVGIGTVIAGWLVLGNIPFMYGANIPYDKLFGYGLLAGLITTSLYGTIGTIWNIYEAIPVGAQTGAGVVLGIVLGIISILAIVGYIEITFGQELA